MLNGSLFSRMLLFAVPLMITSTLQQLFNAIDVAIIGQFAGPQAMAAVGSNGPIINLVVNLLVGMSVGSNVVIANYIGQGHREKVSATVHTTVLIALTGGIFFGLVGMISAWPILNAMDSPPDVIYMAVKYLRLYFAGIPLMALYNFCAAILRSKGDTIRPLICLLISGIMKAGMNLLFVAVFNWGVTGVATATIIANTISASIIIWMLTHETGEFRLEPGKLRFYRENLIRIVKIGLPSGVQGMVFSLSNIFIQAAINGFGSEAIAGSSAALNFEYFCYFVLNAFVQTTMTFTGQNYGAGNMKRCRKIWIMGMLMGISATLAFNLLFFTGRTVLIGLFTGVPSVAAWAYVRMQHVLLFQWIANSYEITGAAMRGMGHSTLPALISVLGTCVMRILWILTIFRQSGSFEMLMDIYPITWVITGAVTLTAYFIIRNKEEKAAEQRRKG